MRPAASSLGSIVGAALLALPRSAQLGARRQRRALGVLRAALAAPTRRLRERHLPVDPIDWSNTMSKLDTDQRNAIGSQQFAFPNQRKEPLENAAHVRNAVARFNQVEGVSDEERDQAWRHIKAAAKKFGVEVPEKSWREVGGKHK
jgi:hypothetical protein